MADISQIQIVPVDNGFFIQVINADGSGQQNPRRVATNREELVKEIKALAENLYSKEPPPPQTTMAVPSQPPTVPVNPQAPR